MDAIFIMHPLCLCCIILLLTSRLQRRVPFRFTDTTLSISSPVICAKGIYGYIPALFTRISIPPTSSTIVLTVSLTSFSLLTSARDSEADTHSATGNNSPLIGKSDKFANGCIFVCWNHNYSDRLFLSATRYILNFCVACQLCRITS